MTGSIDLVWADRIPRADADADWHLVTAEGRWQHLAYRRRSRTVLGSSGAHVDRSRAADVLVALEDAGFFGLGPALPQAEDVVEGDILVVTARAGARFHRVVARPPDALPGPVAQALDRLRDLGRDVPQVAPADLYWRADAMDAARADRVRRRAMVPHVRPEGRGPPLPAALLWAVADPGVWVAVGSDEVEWSRRLAGGTEEWVLEGPTTSWLVELWRGRRSGAE